MLALHLAHTKTQFLMPFPITLQIVTRAFFWILIISIRIFAHLIVKEVPQNYWFYATLILLALALFVAVSYIDSDEFVLDMREICLYSALVYGIGLFLYLLKIDPTWLMVCLTDAITYLIFGRLLWCSKNKNTGQFVNWPVFGIVGWYAQRIKRTETTSTVSPTVRQVTAAYLFILSCIAAGFILPQLGFNIAIAHIGFIAFVATPFIAKHVLADMKRQHAAYLKSLEDADAERERAIAEQARADAQQEIAAEKERSNQQLAAKNAELEQANVEIQALLAEQAKDKALLEKFNHSLRDASHDLQHPMAVVRIHADELTAMSEEEFWDKEKWRAVAQKLDIAIEEMTDMIDATVHSAQVVTGIIQPDVRVIDMNALLKKFNQLWLNGPNRRGLDYMLTYPVNHAGLYCPFDLIILKRILRNLIANAIQHSSADKGILLALRHRDGRCVIEVRDSGPGILEGLGKDKVANFAAFAKRIREEGSQVKQSGSRSGYRLGMSNVLQLCVATGLTMQLCAKEGRGSKFSFSLPLASADQFSETIHIRNAIEAQWQEAGDLLAAYADLPMAEGDFFPEDDDLKRHNLMPSSPNGVNGTPG